MQEIIVSLLSGLLGGGGVFAGLRWWTNYQIQKQREETAAKLGITIEAYKHESSIIEHYINANKDLQVRVAKVELQEENCQERLRKAELEIMALKELLSYEKLTNIVAIVEGNTEGIITEWNEGAQKVFGYTANEIIGQRIDRLTPPRLRGLHNTAFQKAVSENRGPVITTPLLSYGVDKNGDEIAISVLPTGWQDKDGNWVYAAEIRRR